MGSCNIRVFLSALFLILLLIGYSYILIQFANCRITDFQEMQRFLVRMYNFKIIIFSAYGISNSIMIKSYKSRFEYELLITGLFCIGFILIATILNYTHLLIIPTQWHLILFNVTTIIFFVMTYLKEKKNELFNYNGEQY